MTQLVLHSSTKTRATWRQQHPPSPRALAYKTRCCVGPQALHAVDVRTPELTIRAGTWALGNTPATSPSPRAPAAPAKREPIIKSLDLDSFEHEVGPAVRSPCFQPLTLPCSL